MRAEGGGCGNARDLKSPAFVIDEMEVKDVELVESHDVEKLENLGLALEIAGDIEHESAVVVARRRR